jgi:hypothetical protein
MLHHATQSVHAEHQSKLVHAVYLANHHKFTLAEFGIQFHFCGPVVAETTGVPFTVWMAPSANAPIDDSDVEEGRGCDIGGHSFEKI